MTFPFSGARTEPGDYSLFVLKNAAGMTVTISERGAALYSWCAPDRYGRKADVLLAESDATTRTGAGMPRWQGRHAEGGVTLRANAGTTELMLHYHLDDDGSLFIDYRARAIAPSPLATMPGPYFNLNGGHGDVGDHMLSIAADYYVEIDVGGEPAGVAAVAGTPFDFRQPAAIGPRLRWHDTQVCLAGGFGHGYFVGSHVAGGQGALREVARVVDPGSGRRLQVFSTESALQFCCAKQAVGLSGHLGYRDGFSLHGCARPALTSSAWPRIVLHAGQEYSQTTVYRLALQA